MQVESTEKNMKCYTLSFIFVWEEIGEIMTLLEQSIPVLFTTDVFNVAGVVDTGGDDIPIVGMEGVVIDGMVVENDAGMVWLGLFRDR
jgi:hypothetical protein